MLELPRTWGVLVRCVAPDPHLSLPFHIYLPEGGRRQSPDRFSTLTR